MDYACRKTELIFKEGFGKLNQLRTHGNRCKISPKHTLSWTVDMHYLAECVSVGYSIDKLFIETLIQLFLRHVITP